MAERRTHLGIVVVGHTDAGKSIATAGLWYKLGSKSYSDELKLTKELERGGTIACTRLDFFADYDYHYGYRHCYHYTIIDAPGCRDFIANMISGASQADVALLMVPASAGDFEASIAKGNHKTGEIEGQTRQHARLCHLLGIKQLIVVVNKMDHRSVNYSENRFNEIRTIVEKILTKIGYKTKKIPFIPMSGLRNENLSRPSDSMAWKERWQCWYGYDGPHGWWKGFAVKIEHETIKGETLVDALRKVVRPPKRESDKPFRMPLSHVYKSKAFGYSHCYVIAGRIEQGKIKPGVNVRFYPSGAKGKAISIEMHHKNLTEALCGDIVGIQVKGSFYKGNMPMPRVGDVMCIEDEKADPNPPKSVEKFTALVFVQDHPGQLKCSQTDEKSGGYKGGYTPSIHVRTAKAPCQMVEIAWKMGKSTNNRKVECPPYIETGDQAEVTFIPRRPLVVCPFEVCKPLGRFAAMDSNSLIMMGKVLSVEYKK